MSSSVAFLMCCRPSKGAADTSCVTQNLLVAAGSVFQAHSGEETARWFLTSFVFGIPCKAIFLTFDC